MAPRELDNLLRQICLSTTHLDRLPCSLPNDQECLRAKLRHLYAAVLAKHSLYEPELWEHWRTDPNSRGKPERTALAASHVSRGDWPLPLPYEHLDDYLARREVPLEMVSKEVVTYAFQWREAHDPALKAPWRKRQIVGKQIGPAREHPDSGMGEDTAARSQVGHFGCFQLENYGGGIKKGVL
ncbi:hypothetical protein BDY17DRAFT_94968 [Neohortaea acidophila]|uniref:Uncharacterized protein n=1 Tax=Neohortaea acidophila TaxID=245834 RepID=A0A6A6Q0P9_9PEZI|nr:uncharacterized protein BDY17DRAFT_94968 [Neohortaea acidophila]KAF2484997.1 hypothetical protein BDY17DRAFT_94968 [Neohortaea acidophila]